MGWDGPNPYSLQFPCSMRGNSLDMLQSGLAMPILKSTQMSVPFGSDMCMSAVCTARVFPCRRLTVPREWHGLPHTYGTVLHREEMRLTVPPDQGTETPPTRKINLKVSDFEHQSLSGSEMAGLLLWQQPVQSSNLCLITQPNQQVEISEDRVKCSNQ